MAEIRCAECGRVYRTRDGLRRHVKAVHGGVVGRVELPGSSVRVPPWVEAELVESATSLDTGGGEPEGEDGVAAGVVGAAGDLKAEWGAEEVDLLAEACDQLGVHVDDVLSFRITDTEVVVIEGPVGYKRVWPRGTVR